ncbi:MAG TPA: sulfite exporter TauE/SafE family protein [Candidatus Eisenbacteria bacterium]|nr:sulfite exporter TauE/SafE family protein [Candidatus Eisenbacteria bacterium]
MGVALDPGAIAARIAVGVVVGTLVGLTGLGGGMLLLPLLISVLGVPPIMAVGSDAVINCLTKVGAGTLHWRRGNVSWRLALSLAYGSLPGAVLGVTLLARIRAAYGSGVNDFLKLVIAILLIVIPISYYLKKRPADLGPSIEAIRHSHYHFGVTLIGFVAGILVGITSIGSGSVILMLLLVFYGFAPSVMVGTDIMHAIFLAGLTGALQFRLGNVDLALVACVLLGSVPGGLLGAYLTKYLNAQRFRQMLCAILVAVGARMLWVSLAHAN